MVVAALNREAGGWIINVLISRLVPSARVPLIRAWGVVVVADGNAVVASVLLHCRNERGTLINI